MWWEDLLACPDCGAPLRTAGAGWLCAGCGRETARAAPLDLTPRRPQARSLVFAPAPPPPGKQLAALDLAPPPARFAGPMPGRDSREFMTYIEGLSPRPKTVLDLGCGPRDQAAPFAHLGLAYVGLDPSGTAADILGDAHVLPFRDAAFDLVFAYAVLEHLYHPYLAAAEARRVLKPGGVFLGTVSQGEPFHASYFHMTPWALLSLAQTCGFEVARLWPGPDTLAALAVMGRYPRPIRWALRAIAALDANAPFLAPRRMRWPAREKQLDRLYRAGSVCFALRAI